MEIISFVTLILCTSTISFLLCYYLFNGRQSPPLPPGPRPWPIIGNLPHLGPQPHQSMAALALVHGPLLHLKMGLVHVVVAASASVAEQFLKVHDANFSSRPPNAGAKYVAYNYKDLVFGPYGPRWRLLRKISTVHIFSAKALDDFRHVRQEEVGALIRALASAGGNPVQLGQSINVCTTNTIARVALGRRVVEHKCGGGDEKAEEFRLTVMELMNLASAFNLGDFIPVIERFDLQGIVSNMKKIHKWFDAFLSTILKEHKIDGTDGVKGHMDLLSTLISLKDGDNNEGGGLTETEIKALLLNLFIAGTDTTSITVEWAVAELIRHPKILTLAQQELDSVVGKNRFVTESDLPKLPFIQAIVKENFRLHPSTPLSLPRIANESCQVNGYFIPKGSTLLVNIWAIGRDPNVWSNPLEFQPDRFLPGQEKCNVDVKGNNFELIPFGSGRRICAGLSLGTRMVQLLIASLIHAFNFDMGNGELAQTLNMEEAYAQILHRAQPLVVYPKPRLACHHLYKAQVQSFHST